MTDERARAAEDLYGLPPEEFTAARDALSRRLKATGDEDAAAEVKRLRKPSVAVWALNAAARRHQAGVARLVEAGAALRAAQEDALSGDASGLRQAGRALADEIERVADLAAAELPGPSAAQRDRIVATLRAAAADPEAADLLRRGVLARDLEAAGFG
ncbi:MAG: hypothetical protein ACRDY7_08025, partial [Acidimicrobiia bacterium]